LFKTSIDSPIDTRAIPIPQIKTPDWEKIFACRIEENGDPLVPASLIPERILAWPHYYHMGLADAVPECYVRKDVLRRLVAASMNLPKGTKLVILDAWRPVVLQQAFFETLIEELHQTHPHASQRELETMATAFVAHPNACEQRPSPHLTGGAVDLTLVDEDGILMEMGTEFDETVSASYTRYYEEKIERGEISSDAEWRYARNRRMLFHAMTAAGFTNFANEWWHFDYGNQLWAFNTHIVDAVVVYGVAAIHKRWG
jgi:D-alanyl-D-alanine dipeptidase